MNVAFNDIRKIMIGLNTSEIKVGYGSWLKLGFGEKIFFDKTKLKGRYMFEINVSSIHSAWRVFKDAEFICGSDDEIDYCSKLLDKLTAGKIVDILELSKFDIRITFESGIIIDFFCQSTEGVTLSALDYINRISFEFYHNGWEQSDSNEVTGKLTEIEKVLSSLSDDCQNRWQNIVPNKDDDNECDNCFYFRGINGHFYFWDYGICSNKESKNDSKLVNVKSGCSKHKELKELI